MIDLTKDFSGEIKVQQSNSQRSLYMHQKEAIEKLNKESKKPIYKALLVIPTGGGKTFTSVYWLLNKIINQNKKVLWLAHRHELLNQTIKTAINSSYKDILPNRESYRYRIISGVHDRPVNIQLDDDFIVASKDSLNNGKEYLEKWVEHNKDNICLVIDEAHHAVAKSYRNIINILENNCKNDLKIIGLTATPMRTDEQEKGLLGKIFSDNICYSVDLNTLINKGILAKPILREFDTKVELEKELTNKDIKAIRMSSNLPENIAKEIALSKKRNNFIVKEYLENKKEYGKCLVFAVNIEHAIVLNSLFRENNIKSDFVVSSIRDLYSGVTISTEENSQKILDFRNDKLDVLINVNILTEGTDIPNVQSVFLTRPTTSAILMNQMIGRGLRGISAGGTEDAYIVSFIDDWKGKINWLSPKKILASGGFNDQCNKKTQKLENTLIPIKLIEEFAKLMNGSVTGVSSNYMDSVPIGSYNFTLFDEENDKEELCEVIVFKELEEAYEQLMINLFNIFRAHNLDSNEAALTDEQLDSLYNHVVDNEFDGYNLDIGFNEEDIKDIFRYYNLTEEAPAFVEFEGRDKYDVSVLAKEITTNDWGPKRQSEFLNEKWADDSLGWKIYFNNNYFIFVSEVNRAIYNELNHQSTPEVKADEIDYSKLSLSKIYKLDKKRWREISDEVYERAKDEDGCYVSATGNYRSYSKKYFHIDHIIPLSKGGLTEVENLQLLTRWENYTKGNKVDSQINELGIDCLEEAMCNFYDDGDTEKAIEIMNLIFEQDKNNIGALNVKASVEYDKGNLRNAVTYINKVLKINEKQVYALNLKALCRFYQKKYEEAIELANQSLAEESDNSWTIGILADTYYEIKNYDIALELYMKILEDENDNGCVNFRVAYIYDNKRKYNLALEYYDRVLAVDKNDATTLNNKGYTLFKMKRYDEALKHYEKAIEIKPENIFIRNKKNLLKKIEELATV